MGRGKVTIGESRAPKDEPAATYTIRPVRLDRKRVAEIRSYRRRPPVNVLWFYMDTGAFNLKNQAWWLPSAVITEARNFGITHIGIGSEDGRRLLIQAFKVIVGSDRMHPEVKWHKYVAAPAKYEVPEHLFAKIEPPQEERDEALIGRMSLAKSRR